MANLNLVTGYAGAPHVTSADQGSFNAAVVGGGTYVTERGSKFSATVVSNNKITVSGGDLIMQGRHISLSGSVDLTINNGAQSKLRNDLIVVRYTKDTSTGKEEANLVVVQGTPADSAPADPTINDSADIFSGAIIADFALYRIPINGISVQPLVPLFTTFQPLSTMRRIVVGTTDPESVTGLAIGDIYLYVEE